MSRQSQDIPIRPRYGIPDEQNENEGVKKIPSTSVKSRKTSSSSTTGVTNQQMASSYSEIPFLAQYPGAVPQQVLNDMIPTTITTKSSIAKGESVEDEDSTEGAEDNSKSSSCEASKTPKRPDSLQCDSTFPYELEGATNIEGEMRHFVAENLEEKLRSASPLNKRDQFSLASHSNTPTTSSGLLTRHFLQTQLPQIDANVLSDIEIEAQYLAASVDNLTENLCNLLHSISSITADNVEVHKNAVNKLTDSMDANIKCMYTIMAKTEEISNSMKPTEQVGHRIREIKRLVDMLDSNM